MSFITGLLTVSTLSVGYSTIKEDIKTINTTIHN